MKIPSTLSAGRLVLLSLTAFAGGAFPIVTAACNKDDAGKVSPDSPRPPPPLPSASGGSAGASACAGGGGTDSDAISAPFFPRTITSSTSGASGASSGSPALPTFCLDPKGDVKTYGDKGKLTMDEVCTTAFDGECEVYKRFGLKRTVVIRYVDDAGKGSTIEAILWQFATPEGAYGMYTKRVIADSDPTEATAPRPIQGMNPAASGALGTGRGYIWRNDQLLEMTYNNENETPEQLAASSEPLLTALGRQVADKLTGNGLPAAAAALPTDKRIPNGVQFYTKDAMGVTGAGAGAVGYYKDGSKRWRDLAIVSDSVATAKDSFKAIRSRPGTLPITIDGVAGVDEAVRVAFEQAKDRPKTEWLAVRRGAEIDAVGDEEYALTPAAAGAGGAGAAASNQGRLSKDDASALIKAWAAQPPHSASAPATATPPGSASAMPASSKPASSGGPK